MQWCVYAATLAGYPQTRRDGRGIAWAESKNQKHIGESYKVLYKVMTYFFPIFQCVVNINLISIILIMIILCCCSVWYCPFTPPAYVHAHTSTCTHLIWNFLSKSPPPRVEKEAALTQLQGPSAVNAAHTQRVHSTGIQWELQHL